VTAHRLSKEHETGQDGRRLVALRDFDAAYVGFGVMFDRGSRYCLPGYFRFTPESGPAIREIHEYTP
jgi:hypothetical protein